MEIIKCDKCGEVFTSKFCPECGKNREDIKVKVPVVFDTYVHGQGENDELYAELGIDADSMQAEVIRQLNYEVKIVYEIKDNKIRAIQFDNGDGLCDIVPVKNKK